MSNIKCIDVSTWQGSIDWKKVKAAGYGHAIIRAGFGCEVSQIDNRFEQNYKNAKAAGVKIGVYWYSYADSVAVAIKEANVCLTILNGRTLDMPVYFDMEESSQTKLGKSTLTAMAKAFCDTIKKGGYAPGVYSNLNWFTNYLDYNALKKLYSIWLAQYYKEAQLDCDMWQYASDGKVSGISGNVDMNIIYNAEIIKSATITEKKEETVRTELKRGDKGIDVLALKYLMMIAADMGIVSVNLAKDGGFGNGTENAVKALQKVFGLTQTGVADESFIHNLYSKINGSYHLKGDFNGDGKVDIKDATAIQKHVAGIK